MSKIYRRVMRKDAGLQDHVHSLPDGSKTQGMLSKPSQSTQFGRHSHIYQHEGLVHETGISFDEPGHSHESIIGATSGPQPVAAKGFPAGAARQDEAQRIGNAWVIRNEDGLVVAKGRTSYEAQMRYKKLVG